MGNSSWIDDAVTALAAKSWCHLPDVLPIDLIRRLNAWADIQNIEGHFKLAGIGKGYDQQTDEAIRGDLTLWLPTINDDQSVFELNRYVESLRVGLNRELFSGLDSFEGHFSIYAPGTFYKRHLDQFRGDDARSITLIIYLNEFWRDGDGGELRLEISPDEEVLIGPTAGTVVLFDSRKFFHEVMPARTERRSFTGWFKVRTLP